MSLRHRWRQSVNVVMLSLTGVCALFTVSVLFFILGYLLWYGGKSLNWAFFTALPTPVGEAGGGMANAIVGSGKLLLLASLVGVPVGLLGGVYLAEFGGQTFSFLVRYTTDLLNGVPLRLLRWGRKRQRPRLRHLRRLRVRLRLRRVTLREKQPEAAGSTGTGARLKLLRHTR